MARYKYRTNDCDVDNKAHLECFRDEQCEWLKWLDDDDFAIRKTLRELIWNEISFTALVRIADTNPDSALNNILIANKMLRGHVAVQVLAIRRLMDTTKNVISLKRLIQKIRTKRSLITRENYVCFDGLPYDYDRVAKESIAKKTIMGINSSWDETTGPQAHLSAEEAHREFDRLAGIDSAKRKRTDLLATSLFQTIESRICKGDAREIAEWSHDYLAHAGSVKSRNLKASYAPSGRKIKHAIKELASATEALSACLPMASGLRGELMVTAQYDIFEKMEMPILTASGVNDAEEFWQSISEEFESDIKAKLDLIAPSFGDPSGKEPRADS